MARLTAKQKAERAAAAAAAARNSPPAGDAPGAPSTHEKKVVGEAGRTVVVVCKMPRGLYLQLHSYTKQDVRVMGGGIETRDVAIRDVDKLRLKPTVLPFGMMPNYSIEAGFSINPGIPSDFWRKWMEQNSKLQLVEEGLVRGFDDEASARAYCREFEKKETGLEPLKQEGDLRVEKTNNPNLSDVEIDSDQKKVA